jgi:TPR repeat protein
MKKILIYLLIIGIVSLNAGSYDKEIEECNLGNAQQCYALALHYLFSPFDKNYTKGLHYYKKACTNNHMFSCTYLGFIYEKGKILKQDFNKAKQYYKKACEGGESNGCEYYTMLEKR